MYTFGHVSLDKPSSLSPPPLSLSLSLSLTLSLSLSLSLSLFDSPSVLGHALWIFHVERVRVHTHRTLRMAWRK